MPSGRGIWRAAFSKRILEMCSRRDCRVWRKMAWPRDFRRRLRSHRIGVAVTDGPYAEGKEIVAGWSFIEAESLARAVEIAKEVPMFTSVEIREITTF